MKLFYIPNTQFRQYYDIKKMKDFADPSEIDMCCSKNMCYDLMTNTLFSIAFLTTSDFHS